LALLDLRSVLFENRTMSVQTLGKDRITLQESCQTGLKDGHER
jgi:hypothetical protein